MPISEKVKDLVYLFCLSSFFLLFRLGNGSLASWDEALYATVAKEIFQSGNWFQLTFQGSPWLDKPPLAIWITAFFYKLFGISEFSARLFSALCGVGTVFVTYLFGARLLNRWTGFIGALVLLSSSHYFRFVRFGMLDSPLTFFIVLTFYFFWLGRERNRYLIYSGVALGLAVLIKGFGALLVLPIIGLYCLLSSELDILTRSSYWIGVMIAVVIALPWYLFEAFVHQNKFMTNVVVKHLFLRTTKALEGHTGNAYFYIRTMINKYHPWIMIGVFSGPLFIFKAIKDRENEIIFLTVWMFTVLGIFTFVQTKLPWYILPLYPALSLSVGYILAKIFKDSQRILVQIVFLGVMIAHVFFSHLFDYDYSRDIKGIAPIVIKHVAEDQIIYLYNYHESPASAFYTHRKSAYLDDEKSFVVKAKEGSKFFCLIHKKNLDSFKDPNLKAGLQDLGSFQDLHLVSLVNS